VLDVALTSKTTKISSRHPIYLRVFSRFYLIFFAAFFTAFFSILNFLFFLDIRRLPQMALGHREPLRTPASAERSRARPNL
jgi:hypothetical protein